MPAPTFSHGSSYVLSRRALMLGAAGLTFVGASSSSRAKEFPTTWKFGNVTITKVMETIVPFSAARAFPGMPVEELDANASWLSPDFYNPATKEIIFSYHAYLIRTPRFDIILDGGIGNNRPLPHDPLHDRWKGPFLDNLRATGVSPDQINFVVNSHFDFDHLGWNTDLVGGKWAPTYPKARYIFDAAEMAELKAAGETNEGKKANYNDCVQPILDAKLADIIDGEHNLGDGIKIVPSRGHSAGHYSVTVSIASKGEQAVLCGDVLHNPIEILHPDWTVLFDHDKEAGRATRIKFIEHYTDSDVAIFPAHFSGPTGGKIVTVNGQRAWRNL